jgi:hypothetical protein
MNSTDVVEHHLNFLHNQHCRRQMCHIDTSHVNEKSELNLTWYYLIE